MKYVSSCYASPDTCFAMLQRNLLSNLSDICISRGADSQSYRSRPNYTINNEPNSSYSTKRSDGRYRKPSNKRPSSYNETEPAQRLKWRRRDPGYTPILTSNPQPQASLLEPKITRSSGGLIASSVMSSSITTTYFSSTHIAIGQFADFEVAINQAYHPHFRSTGRSVTLTHLISWRYSTNFQRQPNS